ncbi:hypothetical protein PRIC2_004243 [Phytophthora ramorum]
MGKDRFVVNPFDELNLSSVEKDTLRDFGHNFIDQNIEKYEEFISNAQRQVDQTKWKLIKTKDDTRVYLDRDPLSRSSGEGDKVDPPEILVTGTTWGTVDDFMYGAVNPTIEAMRIKATLQRKLAFVGADHQLEMRKVSFCGVCLQNVRSTSPLEAAREDAMGPSKRIVYFDSSLTSSSVSS